MDKGFMDVEADDYDGADDFFSSAQSSAPKAAAPVPAAPKTSAPAVAPGRRIQPAAPAAPVEAPVPAATSSAIDEIADYSAYAATPEEEPAPVQAATAADAGTKDTEARLREALTSGASEPFRMEPPPVRHEADGPVHDDRHATGFEQASAAGASPDADPDMEVDDSLIDNLIYKGISNAQEVCEALVRSGGLPKEEVTRFWNDYSSYVKSDFYRDRIANLDARARQILADEAREMRSEAATGAANGGALSSLFGPMMAKRQARRRELAREVLANNKAALEADKVVANNAFAVKAHGRLFKVKQNLYSESMAKLFGNVEDMAGSVRSYNDTFFDCPEAAPFKDAATAYAEASGLTIPEVMEAAARGEAPTQVLESLKAVSAKAMANPDVKAAHDRILANEARVQEGYLAAAKTGEQMAKTFPGQFDHDNQRDALVESLNAAIENTPKPVAEEDSEMAERLKKMVEDLHEAFSKIFESLANLFKR